MNKNLVSNTKKNKLVSYSKYGYFFIAPFFIIFLVFQLWPLLSTFYYSMFNYYTRYGVEYKSAYGFNNYLNILGINAGEKAFFFTYLKNTFALWFFNFIPQILISLVLAAWLTDNRIKTKGRGIVKIMIYMPGIITAASISVMFNSMLSKYGPVTETLRNWGLISENFDLFMSVNGTRGTISGILTWMWYGNTTLLLIAGMLGISPSYYEAADIDGASGFKKFTKITLPSLKPIMVFVLVTSAIGGLQMYDIPALFNTTQSTLVGLPNDKSTTMFMYIMRLHNTDIGKSAAISVLLFFVSVIVSLALFRSMREKSVKPRHKSAKEGV